MPVMWVPECFGVFAENRYNLDQTKSTGICKEKLSIVIPFINCSTYVQYGRPAE